MSLSINYSLLRAEASLTKEKHKSMNMDINILKAMW